MKKYLILKIGEANYNSLKPVVLFLVFVLIPVAAFALFDYPILNFLIDNPKLLWALCWAAFAVFSGWSEALLFDKYSQINIELSVNPHILLNCVRFFAWIPIVFLIGRVHACSLVLAFPFIHDGVYYYKRNKLNSYIYTNGFFSNPSKTSTAILDLKLWLRLVLFVASVSILIFL